MTRHEMSTLVLYLLAGRQAGRPVAYDGLRPAVNSCAKGLYPIARWDTQSLTCPYLLGKCFFLLKNKKLILAKIVKSNHIRTGVNLNGSKSLVESAP